MGMCVTKCDVIGAELRFLQNACGGIPSPFDCFLVNRGIKTLGLRMQQHEENAMALAQFLSHSEKVTHVMYPGLVTHPGHDIAVKQMAGFSGMISIRIKGSITYFPVVSQPTTSLTPLL